MRLDVVRAVMPEEHMKLLTNIIRMKERKERKLAANLRRDQITFIKRNYFPELTHAIDAYSRALLAIPMTIADNAGLD